MPTPRVPFPLLLVAAALALLAGACAPPAAPPAGDDAVLLGRVFDAGRGRVIEHAEVVVAAGRIRCSGPRGGCATAPGTPVHDHGDALILPGLIDLHVHARPHYLGAFLPAGVTTIRDANNTLSMLGHLRADPDAPRIVATGPMLDGPATVMTADPAQAVLGSRSLDELMPIVVDTPAAAVAAVQALVEAGVEWIKLYEQMAIEVFEAAVEAAREAGIPVMVDLGTAFTRGLNGAEVDIVQAARAGVASNEHLGGLALAYRRRGGDPEAEHLDHALIDDIVASIAGSPMAVVPTVGNVLQFQAPGSLDYLDVPGAAPMAPHFTGYWRYLEGAVAPGHARAQADHRLLLATLPRLVAAGVAVGAGSDLPAAPYMLPGGALHQELAALVQAGLTPIQALQAATRVAAGILGRDDIGHLGAGARADILVVRGDPTRDIHDSRDVAAVWFDGREVDLDAAWRRVASTLEAAAE